MTFTNAAAQSNRGEQYEMQDFLGFNLRLFETNMGHPFMLGWSLGLRM